MKTTMLFTTMFTLISVSLSAQYKYEMSEELKRDEVPVVVQLSLQRDLTAPATEGRWELDYLETTIVNSHTAVFKPELYRYSCKLNGDRVEFFYTPEGILDHTKGIEEIKVGSCDSEPVKSKQ